MPSPFHLISCTAKILILYLTISLSVPFKAPLLYRLRIPRSKNKVHFSFAGSVIVSPVQYPRLSLRFRDYFLFTGWSRQHHAQPPFWRTISSALVSPDPASHWGCLPNLLWQGCSGFQGSPRGGEKRNWVGEAMRCYSDTAPCGALALPHLSPDKRYSRSILVS